MIHLVSFFNSSEDAYRVLDRRLVDEHRLKSALERRILFDIFSVFVKCGSAYTMKLSSCKHGL